MNLIQRILPSDSRYLDGTEVTKRLLYVWSLSFALKWIGIVLGGIQAGSMFVRWQPLPNFRLAVIGVFLWLNYLWIRRFLRWMKPVVSDTQGRLRIFACVGAIYLLWNRFRFGVLQDGVGTACDAASGYLLTAFLSEVPNWKAAVLVIADLLNAGHHITEFLAFVQHVEDVCITDTRRFMAGS